MVGPEPDQRGELARMGVEVIDRIADVGGWRTDATLAAKRHRLAYLEVLPEEQGASCARPPQSETNEETPGEP